MFHSKKWHPASEPSHYISHLLSPCPTTAALQTSLPTPLGTSCTTQVPPVALSTQNNLVYSTNLCSPSTCQGGFSVCSDCQETCSEPIRCQAFCVVSSPCYHLRTSTFFSPCQRTFSGSLGFGSSNFGSFGCGSPSLGFRSSGF